MKRKKTSVTPFSNHSEEVHGGEQGVWGGEKIFFYLIFLHPDWVDRQK